MTSLRTEERALQSIHLIISGRVQGVGYRMWVHEQAFALGLSGWVRNRRDGTVEALICGDAISIKDMLARVRHGPLGARVDPVFETEWDGDVPDGFEVLATE